MNSRDISDSSVYPEGERKVCSNIYTIFAHIAIFKPLLKCVFPEISSSLNSTTNEFGFPGFRETFIRDEENLTKIVEYFKSEENIIKFAKKVEIQYLMFRDAFDRAGINDSHKNAYVMAIATLRSIANQKVEEIKDSKKNFTSINAEKVSVANITDQINFKFREIFEGYREQVIAGDIEGNLVKEKEGRIKDFFGRKITKVNGRFIYTDSRTPVLVEGYEIISLLRTKTLPNGENVRKGKIRSKGGDEKTIYITKDNKILKAEWFDSTREVINIYGLETLFDGKKIISVELGTNVMHDGKNNFVKMEMFLTEENEIYMIEHEGTKLTPYYMIKNHHQEYLFVKTYEGKFKIYKNRIEKVKD